MSDVDVDSLIDFGVFARDIRKVNKFRYHFLEVCRINLVA